MLARASDAEVLRLGFRTPGWDVTRVYKVTNPALDAMFECCRAQLQKQRRNAVSITVYHGTSRLATGGIAQTGFDERANGAAHGQAYGTGIYVTSCMNTAMSYAGGMSDCKGSAYVIVAEYLPGAVGSHRAPGRDPFALDSYQGGSENIWVARRTIQLLPKYIVHLRHQCE